MHISISFNCQEYLFKAIDSNLIIWRYGRYHFNATMNIRDPFQWRKSPFRYIDSQYKDTTVITSSYYYNGSSSAGSIALLYDMDLSTGAQQNNTVIVMSYISSNDYINLPIVYLGDNERAARVLFVQHPREQGEWCSQNPSVVSVLTYSFALLPRVLDKQHPSWPVIIPL